MVKAPAPPEPRLHRAARLGDIAELEVVAASGADLDARADLEVDNGPHLRCLTALMVAARSIDGASVETLRWLLDHGADLAARSEGGETAAWYAAGKGGRWSFHEWRLWPDHAERLRFLLDAGLDPRETNSVGRSLLTEACEAGDPARVRLLLERGAPPHPVFDPRAEESRHRALLAALLASYELQGKTPPEIEAHREALAAIRPPPVLPPSFAVPLHCAADSGSAECVRLLLDAGVPPSVPSDGAPTALFVAGSAGVARVLLEAGVDPRVEQEDGGDALTALLEGGCGLRSCDADRFAAAGVLIEAGVDIDRIEKWPHTRLAQAGFGHHAEAVDFLLARGAKVEPPPGAPTTLHCICWQGESGDIDLNTDCERIIRSLVRAGVPVDARDIEGRTPLHEAASGDWGNETAVRVLLELGADPDPADPEGVTPLMLAAGHPGLEVVRLLLAAGADPLRESREGPSALRIAQDNRSTWMRINESAPQAFPALPEPEDRIRERHAEALAEAEESLRLIEEAAARRGAAGETTG